MLADDSGGHCELYSFTLTYNQFIAHRSPPQGGYGMNLEMRRRVAVLRP
jgi:hypothetical protein